MLLSPFPSKHGPSRYHDDLSNKEYESLVKNVLRAGVVDVAGRAQLRKHRVKHGIDAMHHLRVLRKLGWSLDDFEEGHIGVYPDPCDDHGPIVDVHRVIPLLTKVLGAVDKDDGDTTSGTRAHEDKDDDGDDVATRTVHDSQ